MITHEKIIPKLEEYGVDLIIASTNTHVYYSSGLLPSTTVTPHAENFEETGYYYDSPSSPPKCFSVWSVEHGGPFLVIPPVSTTQLADFDIDPVEIRIYSPDEYMLPHEGELSADSRKIMDALDNRHDTIYDGLEVVLGELTDSTTHVALERMSLSPTVFEHVESRIEYEELSEATEIFHDLRRIKTDEEVRRLRTAAEIHERAIEAAVDQLEAGMTESEFADIFRSFQCEQGAKPGHTNIAFGDHTAYAHAIPGDRELRAGDLVRFEAGIDYQHYPADLARTYAFKSATDDAKQRYQVIREGLKRAEEMMVDGASTTDVHNAAMDRARETASEVGANALTEWTCRHIGHNMGLDVHDHPLLSPTMREYGDDTLRAGMVMNYEAAHLILESGGVQIEDTALITEDGIEAFSSAPDELPIID